MAGETCGAGPHRVGMTGCKNQQTKGGAWRACDEVDEQDSP